MSSFVTSSLDFTSQSLPLVLTQSSSSETAQISTQPTYNYPDLLSRNNTDGENNYLDYLLTEMNDTPLGIFTLETMQSQGITIVQKDSLPDGSVSTINLAEREIWLGTNAFSNPTPENINKTINHEFFHIYDQETYATMQNELAALIYGAVQRASEYGEVAATQEALLSYLNNAAVASLGRGATVQLQLANYRADGVPDETDMESRELLIETLDQVYPGMDWGTSIRALYSDLLG